MKVKLYKKRIFNIGSTRPTKIKNVIKEIVKITGKGKPNFGKIKLRKGEIMNMYPDTKSMRTKLRWSPKIPLSKGLKITINSFKNERKF